jgi:hypothetical protein
MSQVYVKTSAFFRVSQQVCEQLQHRLRERFFEGLLARALAWGVRRLVGQRTNTLAAAGLLVPGIVARAGRGAVATPAVPPLIRPDLPASPTPLQTLDHSAHASAQISHPRRPSTDRPPPNHVPQPYPHKDSVAALRTLADAFGAQRLMWGTDWPWVQEHGG